MIWMAWMMEPEFAEALWSSPTFLPSLAWPLMAFLGPGGVMLAALAFVGWARFSLPALSRDVTGTALAADLVLVMVPVIAVMLILTQSLWLMREIVIVHYAAYGAARSGRVMLCPIVPETGRALMLQAAGKLGCTGDAHKAEMAARLALVSASPPWPVPCLGNCRFPDRPLRAIAGETGAGALYPALEAQAEYAFDPDNVKVEIGFDPRYLAFAAKPGLTPPVRARLTFRHYVIYGLGPVFGQPRSDGYYYKETVAEVTVL